MQQRPSAQSSEPHALQSSALLSPALLSSSVAHPATLDVDFAVISIAQRPSAQVDVQDFSASFTRLSDRAWICVITKHRASSVDTNLNIFLKFNLTKNDIANL